MEQKCCLVQEDIRELLLSTRYSSSTESVSSIAILSTFSRLREVILLIRVLSLRDFYCIKSSFANMFLELNCSFYSLFDSKVFFKSCRRDSDCRDNFEMISLFLKLGLYSLLFNLFSKTLI